MPGLVRRGDPSQRLGQSTMETCGSAGSASYDPTMRDGLFYLISFASGALVFGWLVLFVALAG
jgi:hypothetical protein